MELSCRQCGATVAPPTDIDARTATCVHCGAPVALTDEWIARQQRERAARDARAAAELERAERRGAERSERRVWFLMFAGIGVAVVGFVIYTLVNAARDQGGATVVRERPPTVSQAALDAGERVKNRLMALHEAGCGHVVEGTTVTLGVAKHVLGMTAGGNCLRAIAAAPPGTKLAATLVAPSGAKSVGTVTDDFVEIEHCPVEDGQHTFEVTADELAYALVDCPAAREKYRDDPDQNGLAIVGARMEQLNQAGCPTVLLAPKTYVAERAMTATMEPGRFCAVIIAASAQPKNQLTATFTTPFGKPIDVPPPSTHVEIVYCATDAGPHALNIAPSMLEYYAIGAMDCPRKLAAKLSKR